MASVPFSDWQYRALTYLVVDAQGLVMAERLSGNVEWERDPTHPSTNMRQRSEWRQVDKLARRIAELAPDRDLEDVLQELNEAVRAARDEAWDSPG